MLIVTEPPNVSTREVIKISRVFAEVTALSYGARALIELEPRQGRLRRMKSNPTKSPPLVLPTPRRVNKTLIVETDETGQEVDVSDVSAATEPVNEYSAPHFSSAVKNVDHDALWPALVDVVLPI